MTLDPREVHRLRNITATPRPAAQEEPPAPVARAMKRERLDFEGSLTERERFESMGVKWDEVKP